MYPLGEFKDLLEVVCGLGSTLYSSNDKEPHPYRRISGLTGRILTCPWNRTGFMASGGAQYSGGHMRVTQELSWSKGGAWGSVDALAYNADYDLIIG
jgi:hypothetical protein